MPISKYHANEYRMKKYAKESAWAKFSRLQELAKHRKRCVTMRPSVDQECPFYSPHILTNQRRANIEEVLGGASNWIGKWEDKPKKLCDARPWRSFNNAQPHPAPFSTLKLSPRGVFGPRGSKDKMRVIEKNLMEMFNRIKEVEEMPSQYTIVKKNYLSRGDSPWPKPPSKSTAEDKLERVKKWEMKHHPKRVSTAPATGFFASLFGTKTPTPRPSRLASTPSSDEAATVAKNELDPKSISSITEEEAEKDEQLAALKAVQEAGDPNF